MSRLALFLAAVALVAGCRSTAEPVASDALAERILANLRVEFPSLGNLDVRVDSLRPSGLDGVLEGQIAVNGQQPQLFLYAAATERLYLLAVPAVDVSRSPDALAAFVARRDSTERASQQAAAARLDALARTLPARGPADARLTLIEFSDFQCPYCARAAATVQQVLAANPDVRLVYAHLPLDGHEWAVPAAMASTCAAQQSDDAFWALHDAYFRDQRGLTPATVIERSRAVLAGAGIDVTAWETCTGDPSSPAYQQAAEAVETQRDLAQSLGVTGTPGFFLGGRLISGAQPAAVFQQAIDAARAR